MSKLEYLPGEITVQVFKHNDPSDEARMIAALRMGECRPPLEASDDTIAGLAFGPIDGATHVKRDEAPDGFVSDVSFVWTAARRDNLPDISPSPPTTAAKQRRNMLIRCGFRNSSRYNN